MNSMWSRPARRRERYVLAATALATVAIVAPAPAQELPEGNSGTDQYIEPVPGAGGDRPASPDPGRGGSGGPSSERRGALPPSVRNALPPGEEGRVLEGLATDPGAGAPTVTESRRGSGAGGSEAGGSGERPKSLGGSSTDESDGSALGALAGAAVGESGPGVPVLLAALLAITLAAAAFGRVGTRRS